eukprot:8269805-Lingulodinium_polyedra.AAC.1
MICWRSGMRSGRSGPASRLTSPPRSMPTTLSTLRPWRGSSGARSCRPGSSGTGRSPTPWR